jgi:FtsP/CotA-like multicopper oxidase with cupredoxin domain
MNSTSRRGITRRFLLASGIALTSTALLPKPSIAEAPREIRLRAGPSRAPLVGGEYPDTAVWAYNDSVPGPAIRVRRGEPLRIAVQNQLDEETAVHWHGLRVPNAMDGVPHLTQRPIAPGESFLYEFAAPDAGTYWYHPHQRSFEQIGRGLYGPLIVEEDEPIQVDRDVTWVLDDWRLLPDASISGDFDNAMDMGMAGRIGNSVTINGRIPDAFAVRSGERVRLRLVNAANARIFALEFPGHDPQLVAYDGQAVAPNPLPGRRAVLGPAMRIDLIVDMTGRPGERVSIVDTFYRGREYRLVDWVYAAEPLRSELLDAPIALPSNDLPEPDLANAERHEMTFGGGMMSGMGGGMGSGMMGGMMPGMNGARRNRHQGIWHVNGVSATGHVMDPVLTFQRDRSVILSLHNDTAWFHPIHLHGHSFRVLSRNGAPTRHREWQDTVLTAPRERVEIAFVADNPGDWMIHCHIAEHLASGMTAVIRVA